MSEIYTFQGNFKEAEKLLLKGNEIDTNNSFVYYRLAFLYFTKKDFEKSFKFIENALRITPTNKEYTILKADILFNKTNYKEALYHLSILEIEKNTHLFLQKLSKINRKWTLIHSKTTVI